MESKLTLILWMACYNWVESSNNAKVVPSIPKYTYYGCTFIDQKYNLGTDHLGCPSWGDTVKPLELSNMNDFKELIDRVTKINREVISSHLYNSVDNLLELFEDYRSFKSSRPIKAKLFAKFYDSYQPKFRPHENFLGLSIDVLDTISNELSGKWNYIKNNIFISSVQVQVPEGDLESTLSQKDGAPSSKVIKHVMATVKFSLQNRLGYILIDPGYNSFKEFVVMEDGKSPQYETKMDQNEDQITKYSVRTLNKNYILSSQTSTSPFLSNSKRMNFLVYVGQPFCSFVDTTAKIDLLKYYRLMVKRDSDGWIKGGFLFRALPGNVTTIHRKVTVFTHTKGKNRVSAHIRLRAFEGTMEEVQENIYSGNDFFGQVATLLNMTTVELVKKIQKVKDMYDFPYFLEEVQLMKEKIEDPKKNNSKGSFLGKIFGSNKTKC